MKIFFTFILFAYCNLLLAQIQLDGPPMVNGVSCDYVILGSIHVHVKQINPPYSFKWSSGQSTEEINGLDPGDYSLEIKDGAGKDTTLHFTVIQEDCELAPEIFFTPNGDGIYDYWYIANAQHFPNALILVYNREGQLVFEHNGEYNDSNHWDGTDLLGSPLPVSTYFYVIYKDKAHKKNVIKGTVSLIR